MYSAENRDYDCRECDSKFKSLEDLDEHMKKAHNLQVSNES